MIISGLEAKVNEKVEGKVRAEILQEDQVLFLAADGGVFQMLPRRRNLMLPRAMEPLVALILALSLESKMPPN